MVCLTFWNLNLVIFGNAAIAYHTPATLQVVKRPAVIAIDNGDFIAPDPQSLDWLNSLLVLDQAGRRSMVGEAKPIHHKMAVIRLVPEVTAVTHVDIAVLVRRAKTLSCISI